MKIRLHELLEREGMSQAELARLTRIRPSTICDMYNNNCSFVKLEHLEKICKRLNCGINDIIEL